MAEARPDYVQSLERGLRVLTTFSAEAPELSLSDVARRTGLKRATSRRILLTLEELGYVASNGRRFSLRPRALDVGYAYLSTMPVAEIAIPFMEELSRHFNESSSVAVLDGTDIVYIARVQANRIMSINLAVGSRLPAYATSMGRVLLAWLTPVELDAYFATARLATLTERTVAREERLREILAEVRARGWALTDQELEDGVRSVAAPLLARDRRAVAAMNMSTHAGRVSLARLRDEFVPRLLEAAEGVSRALRSR